MATYKYFLVDTPTPYVAHVQINRPQKMNAFMEEMWLELKLVFDTLSHSPDIRAIILSGAGDRAFTSGLDVQAASQVRYPGADAARKATSIRRHVQEFQDCIGSIEVCEKPVICVMHGISFGLAIDICTAADIRICSADVKMAVKEVDIGLAADIGTLSRLPRVVGSYSWVKDVCLSARIFGAEEAYRVGLVSHVQENKAAALDKALEMAKTLAEKSPIAVQGTKELLNHGRDHKLADSLRYTGVWNSVGIQTTDVERAMMSGLKKTRPRFEKL
ncbi:hypothetical protein HYFRA_00001582 [Hymenoscyphus fraxineus]|uniref:Uncharacterized protein n=1 Tax=Hymenoscyphus fraxineus TaxID=746836 RepID=A0A9N9PZF9_9HELO|nr:hypothetical protein HYFRA_00001582 [Hymenoscyphus fraxineus]